jgi:hypothetical protein
MTDETRTTIEKFEFMFGPDQVSVSIARNLRNVFFGFTGRVIFNLFTDPAATYKEFRDFSYKEHRDRALSDKFINIFVARFAFELIVNLLGMAMLYYYGSFNREDRVRKKREDNNTVDDLLMDEVSISAGMDNVLSNLLESSIMF